MKTHMKTKRTKGSASNPATVGSAATPVPPAGRRNARFEIHVDGAREVHLAGSFNDWSPTTLPMTDKGNGHWETEVPLSSGVHEYLFVADGHWIPDPHAPETTPNPHGGVNSVRHVP